MKTTKNPTDKLQVNLPRMLVSVVGFTLLAIYATIAFSAQDPLWFLTTFDQRPIRIIIYNTGQKTELQPGDPGFAELAEAIRVSLASGAARMSGLGLSAGSLEDAYTQYVTVEAFLANRSSCTPGSTPAGHGRYCFLSQGDMPI